MMRRFIQGGLVAIALSCASLPAATQAAEVTQMQFSGRTVQAEFLSFDPSGCIGTYVGLQAIEDRTQTTGQPATTSSVLMAIVQRDVCQDQALIMEAAGVTQVPVGTLQIDQQLKAAALTARLQVFDDVTASEYPVDVNLAWTATGEPAYQYKARVQSSGPGYRLNSLTTGTIRPAVASGTVSLAGSRNLAPEPSVQARIKDARSGTVEIVH
jgi:hypothetical protein